jgi:hypothetical protein
MKIFFSSILLNALLLGKKYLLAAPDNAAQMQLPEASNA